MTTAAGDLLIDSFGRVREEVHAVLDGISEAVLHWRMDADANSIAWLMWHLIRVQDDHVAKSFDRPQLWHEDGWMERFQLPFDRDAHGYGHSSDDVARVVTTAELLTGYVDAVTDRTVDDLRALGDAELARVVDDRWDPPVTLSVRLVSVIADDLQHVGQAAILRGVAERAGIS